MSGIRIHPFQLQFKRPAKTSRNTLLEKQCYLLIYGTPLRAIGECNFFQGLSADNPSNYDSVLKGACKRLEVLFGLEAPLEDERFDALVCELAHYPSIQFGIEQLWYSYHAKTPFHLYDSAFSNHEEGIAINGLVWMGDIPFMRQQVDNLISDGFRCIKLKIGAENFEHEQRLLQDLRGKYGADELEIRVDANGSFSPETAPKILDQLAQLEIHSIEQPIAAGQWDQMAALCEFSPVPIALDEELIGLFSLDDKKRCLDHIRPHYLILKPALIGGFKACNEFIESDFDWWITSALESNIGLNAIAQFTSTKKLHRPQGLGTGGLFVNNFESPLEVCNAQLFYRNHLTWNLNSIA
ncbi:MAG: o-succinylbenzoate synthase [Flavobacteriaceae bacterium]